LEKILSVIVPCYNEEESIPFFYDAMEKIQGDIGYRFEYIFINDGSDDRTMEVLRDLRKKNPDKVRYVSFSRNFGKEAALYAGLKEAAGQLITIMDVDLQDPPELIPQMISGIEEEGFDCVGTKRTDRRGEPPLRSLFAKLFYRMENGVSDIEIVDGARDFRLMTRQMADAVLEMAEYNRFSKGLFAWVGFKTKYLSFDNTPREHGKTSWSFFNLFRYSVEGIINFSNFPLRIATFCGLIAFIISFVAMIFFFLRTLLFGNPTDGWTSTAVIILFIGSIQLLAIGVIGEYIGRIFLETKKRPVFIVREKSNDPDDADR